MRKRILVRVVKLFLLVYALAGILFYYLQDKLLFHPVVVEREQPYAFEQPHEELNIPYSEGSNISIVEFRSNLPKPKGVVLYFHGNKTNISRYAPYAPLFTSYGYEVWMIDYPGFGKSTGDFTEQRLYDWALVFYKLARARFTPDSIIIYGKSLGTGVASQLASIRDCRHLVLETPYYSFPSVPASYVPIYPFDRMVHMKLPVWKYLQNVTAPVTILHGTADWIIPIRNARRLAAYLKKTDEFITIAGGSHNNLADYEQFRNAVGGILSK